MRVVCILFPKPEPRVRAFAEACYRVTPQVAIGGEGRAVFLEISQVSHLYPEPMILLRAKALIRRLGWRPEKARIQVASDPALAWSLLLHPEWKEREELPVSVLRAYEDPFVEEGGWEEEFLKHHRGMVKSLELLGIRTLGDFLRLPVRDLAARFGRSGLRLRERVERGYCSPWPRYRPPTRIHERINLRGVENLIAPTDLDSILSLLREVLERTVLRLRGRNERISGLRLCFHLEKHHQAKGWIREWRIAFPVPQGGVATLLPILRERLSYELERQPLEAPVAEAELEVLETAPGHGNQSDFFSKANQEREEWDGLVIRLSEKLGSDRVFYAKEVDRHLPESAWMRDASFEVAEEKEKLREMPSRPSRLLSKPLLLLEEKGRFIDSRVPARSWRVLKRIGPERLTGEWWLDPNGRGWARDYYRIHFESGEIAWGYRELGKEGFWLQGWFD